MGFVNVWLQSDVVMHEFSLADREPLFDCLKDVDLIPPFNRMLLEVTFGKLYSWAVHNIRNILLEAGARFKELGKWLVYTSALSPEPHQRGSVKKRFLVAQLCVNQVYSRFLCRPSPMKTQRAQVSAPFHRHDSSCP